MRFFFDNCFSSNIVNALRSVEPRHELIHSMDKFLPETPDSVWIAKLAQDGDWIVISADPRISRGQAERAAWLESGLTVFFCGSGWGGHKLIMQASEFLGWWESILLKSKDAPRGAGYLLEYGSREPRQIYPQLEKKRVKRKR